MSVRLTRSEAGFTYIAALFAVVVMGIMLGVTGQSMRVIMQRENEKELIFRGLQYRDAIESWTRKGAMPLLDIKYLIKDPRSATGAKYLRQLYKDPFTGKDFKLIIDPNTKEIQGVASTSSQEPFKVGNFPDVIAAFAEKKKYSDWEFVYKRPVRSATGAPPANQQQQQQISLPLSSPESL